ncbi:MAG: hypothetical protein IJ220_05690 [Clostridia bacterium]|nr:hypothetical protein [Clostridia bacterium]
MNNHSRTKNTIFNFIGNSLYQIIIIVLTFITRRVFIKTLGVEYLGISGLFTNILSVLSLADLGIGSAIYYSMYKAVAEKDEDKLAALTNYYRTMYNKIALIVFIIGISFMPFLRYIINLEKDIPHIELYYFISILSTVFSYLFVYKTSVLYADQSEYKLKGLFIIIQLIKSIGGILIIYFTMNFIFYISFNAIMGIIGNLICSKYAEKQYPFINKKVSLDEKEKKGIWENIGAMFLYKFSSIILNNTDNIIISILVGTNMVGYYSNYTMIYNKIFGITDIFFNSFKSSVGNMNNNSTKEKKYQMFKVISLLSFWVFSFACIGIFFCRR